MIPITIIAILSYLVGSIPTAIIVAKSRKGIDIRQHGSGNAGGTNVIRVLGWKTGVFVIVCDMAKGLFATMVVSRLLFVLPFASNPPFDDFTVVQIIAGCVAMLGHIWTLFAGFKGGKGIATAGGMLIGVAPVEVAVSLGVFMIVFLISHYVSLGSLTAATTFPVTMFLRENVFMVDIQGYHTLIWFSIGVSLLIIYTHRSNVQRLLRGTENRIARIPVFNRR
ncbi:MAG: glycerol-3-phosphate 1-O-acyltransferase PlsY [Bacteroidetes bacterium]|nr:glycerol-3-phosphate 1-O-acyltransferase PlsY [Bacteroidota bacterium]MCW5895401.1 glycerol-3-phosphate 1-O-acyltransferase PlsY [Bacteroidota bacterium]